MNEKSCKDCLHYEACDMYEDLDGYRSKTICSNFTEKSEWVHLPCKVNSTVYIASEYHGVIESKVRKIFLGLNGAEMIRTQHYDIPFSNWGKTTFLTREEANKALEERRKEDEG